MELSQFTRMMHQKGAQQIIITPDQPMRILSGGKWQQTTLFTPSEHAINTMLQNCVPPNLQGSWRQETITFSFPHQTSSGKFEVEVKNVPGSRTLTITDIDAAPGASTPAPVVQAAAPAFTLSSSSSLAPPPLKATSQIAREMGKGSVNILTPPTPTAQSTSAATNTPRTPAAPRRSTPASLSEAVGPPSLPQISWYHAAGGKQIGPVPQMNIEQCIASNIVHPETMVWRDGMPDWAMAKLTELGPLFGTQQLPPPMANNASGHGMGSILPAELQGVNWGAFFLSFFWVLAHRTWIGLLIFVPYVGWIMSFVLLFKGNEWAWQNRQWESIEQFRAVQRTWARWGVGIMIAGFTFGFLALLPAFSRAKENARRASCQSNLKQMALAAAQYQQDYDEVLPPAAGGGQPVGWADAVEPYIRTETVFRCPSESDHPNSRSPLDIGYSSYRYNSDLSSRNYIEINNSATTILFAEGSGNDPQSNAAYSDSFGFEEKIPNAPPRHLDGANYAFVDGHVKWFSSSRMGE